MKASVLFIVSMLVVIILLCMNSVSFGDSRNHSYVDSYGSGPGWGFSFGYAHPPVPYFYHPYTPYRYHYPYWHPYGPRPHYPAPVPKHHGYRPGPGHSNLEFGNKNFQFKLDLPK